MPLAVLLIGSGFQLTRHENADATASGLGFTEDPTRLIVYGAAYLWALAWLASRAETARQVLARLWPWAALLAFMIMSALWSRFPLKVLIDWGHSCGVTLAVAAAAIALNCDQQKTARVLAWCTFAVVSLSLLAVVTGRSDSIDFDSGRWAGATGNANTLGLFAAVCVWAAMQEALHARGVHRASGAGMIAVAVFVLLQTGSMSSLAMMVLMTLALLLGATTPISAAALIYRAAAAIGVMLFLGLVIYTASPEAATTTSALDAAGRSTTFTGRTALWETGWELFLLRPVAGFGFDSLASVLYQADLGVGQLHNGYLDLLVRGGVIGFALLLMLIVLGLVSALRAVRARPRLAIANAALMAGILVHNITESSLIRGTHLLWVLYLLALASLAYSALRSGEREAPSNAQHSDGDRQPHATVLPNLLR